jgi:glycine betaine/choline ABC-type transport system substrate-binding protein
MDSTPPHPDADESVHVGEGVALLLQGTADISILSPKRLVILSDDAQAGILYRITSLVRKELLALRWKLVVVEIQC